jgi:hypothetical protein
VIFDTVTHHSCICCVPCGCCRELNRVAGMCDNCLASVRHEREAVQPPQAGNLLKTHSRRHFSCLKSIVTGKCAYMSRKVLYQHSQNVRRVNILLRVAA